jgi:signal peptidase I
VSSRAYRKGRRRASVKPGGLAETLRFLLMLFVAALLLRSLVFAPFSIPSGSMLPRLMIGDYLFVAKWPYGYSRYSVPFGLASFDGRLFGDTPERGDVVVFRFPGSGSEDYIKRVIGLPGDTIQMRDGSLILNGKPVPRTRIADYLMPISPNSPCRTVDPDVARVAEGEDGTRACAYTRYRETLPGGRSYEVLDQVDGPADNRDAVQVPAGHYFVMGDNRDDSEDSRFPQAIGGVGMLPADYLIGRALITFFSTDGSAALLKPWTWPSATRWPRIGMTF